MRYMTEPEYIALRARGCIRDGKLTITLPEPGGARVHEPVCVLTEPVPTTLTSYGVRIYAHDPHEWAQTHKHPAY